MLIDEAQDNKESPVTSADADRLIAQSRALLIPSENGRGFGQRYYRPEWTDWQKNNAKPCGPLADPEPTAGVAESVPRWIERPSNGTFR